MKFWQMYVIAIIFVLLSISALFFIPPTPLTDFLFIFLMLIAFILICVGGVIYAFTAGFLYGYKKVRKRKV